VRDNSKLIEQAYEKLEQRYTREPSVKEIAKEVNIDEQEVAEIIKDSLFANLLSIESKTSDVGNEQRESLRNTIPDHIELNPEQQYEQKEKVEELAQLINTLNEKEQLVISLFYKEGLSLTEIGDVLELTTSRISQIHSQSIAKLRKLLASNEEG